MTANENSPPRVRGALIALWTVQILLAAMFLMAGGSKLAGVADMVKLYDTIGWGQWFRYVTGIIEVTAGITLLIPTLAVFGALLIIPTMIGASVANVVVVHTSPVVTIVLMLCAVGIVWARRHQLPRF
jgi:putative oxidoreductase